MMPLDRRAYDFDRAIHFHVPFLADSRLLKSFRVPRLRSDCGSTLHHLP